MSEKRIYRAYEVTIVSINGEHFEFWHPTRPAKIRLHTSELTRKGYTNLKPGVPFWIQKKSKIYILPEDQVDPRDKNSE